MAAGDCRSTRYGVEVAGDRGNPRTHFTRFGVEVLGKPPTPKTRLSRHGIEVLGDRPAVRTHLTRYNVEVVGKPPAPKTRLTRFGIEVLGGRTAVIPKTFHTRYGVEVAGRIPDPKTYVSRFGVEIIGKATVIANTRHTRYGLEVLGIPPKRTLLSRFGIEIIGQIFSRKRRRMIPNPLPAVLANIFSHNWATTAKLESAYLTDVTSAGSTLAEERRGLVDRPYRTLMARFVGFNQNELLRMNMTLARHSHQRLPVPLFTDHSRVTADSSGFTINCSTLHRRFFQNGRVLIHKWSQDGRPDTIEYAQIDGIQTNGLLLKEPLTQTYPAGSRVYPLIEAEINLEGAMQLLSDHTGDIELAVKEVIGRSAMPPTVDGGNPPGFQIYNGRPIFDVPLDWSANVRTSVFREGYTFSSGRAEVVYVAGTRPQFEHEMRMTLLTREKVWKVVQFFDSRMGRLRSFYMVHPASLFEPNSILTTQVRIQPAGNIEDLQDFMKHVGIVKRDGTIYVRGVSSVTVDGAEWVIAFDSAIPSTDLADVRKVTPAYLVRLKEDAMLEEWSTDETCSISLIGIEVLDDTDQELENTSVVLAGAPPLQVPDLHLWAMPTRHTWADSSRVTSADPGAEPDVLGASVALWDDARRSPGDVWMEGVNAPGHLLNSNPVRNNCRPGLHFNGTAGKWRLRPLGEDFFDNASGKGLTLFVAYQVGASVGTWTAFLHKAGVLEFGPTVCKMFETLDNEVGDNNITYPNLLSGDLNDNVVAILTWSPGTYARVYKNGVLQGSATTPVVDLPSEASREAEVFSMQSQIDANDTLIYRRALSTAELNTVGRFLAAMYDSDWTDIT